MRVAGLCALLIAVSVPGWAAAQDVAAEYTADEFVKAILNGPKPCPVGQTIEQCEANPKTRRFTLAAPAEKEKPRAPPRRTVQAQQDGGFLMTARVKKPPKLTAADVLVTFAKGSAEITPQGQANLRSIAAGLNKPALAAIQFEIAGFTDVSGPYAFNRTLSRARAEAVKAFLASLNVQPDRLVAVGYGPDHLIDPADPTSEANRRVELHRLN